MHKYKVKGNDVNKQVSAVCKKTFPQFFQLHRDEVVIWLGVKAKSFVLKQTGIHSSILAKTLVIGFCNISDFE